MVWLYPKTLVCLYPECLAWLYPKGSVWLYPKCFAWLYPEGLGWLYQKTLVWLYHTYLVAYILNIWFVHILYMVWFGLPRLPEKRTSLQTSFLQTELKIITETFSTFLTNNNYCF